MQKLNSEIDLDFKKFFRWWKRELQFLIPDRVKELISERKGTIIVRPVGKQFGLSYWFDGKEEALATIERDESGIAKYKALLNANERLQKADLILRLSRKYALQKELSLPAAARENLVQVVGYELSRYSPLSAEHAYFAVKPLDVTNEPGQIRVMLVLTARKVLDSFYNDLKVFGMRPNLADFDDFPNDLAQIDEPYNLLPESLREPVDRTAQLVHAGLAVLVGLLFIATLALPVWFEARAVDNLEARIKAVEKEAKNIKAMQAETDALVDETKQLLDIKSEKPPVVALLDTLSKLIKDDTWLAYGQYSNGQLQIQGESPEASSLISMLEASDYFDNVKFVSPVTRDNVSKLERFQITADISKAGDKSGTGKQ
jgi:general secretion pathway protein L